MKCLPWHELVVFGVGHLRSSAFLSMFAILAFGEYLGAFHLMSQSAVVMESLWKLGSGLNPEHQYERLNSERLCGLWF